MLSVLRQAWNSWKSAKGVALLAILALAVGIGSATAIYTVAHAVLLKPLPYRDGERFVALYGASANEPGKKTGMSDAYLHSFEQQQRGFDVFGWFTYGGDFNLNFAGQPEHINGVRVTPRLLDSLGVQPYLGRWFGEAGQESGNYRLVVLAYPLWRRLGGHRDIIGQDLVLEGLNYTVTGVAPAWFHFPLFDVSGQADRNELWMPISPEYVKSVSTQGLFLGYARRKTGVSFEKASEDVKRISAQLAGEDPAWKHTAARIEPLRATISAEIRPALLLLLAAAGLLLLITCANVSGLLVARAVSRARDTAVRVALGAAHWQLALQYFSESLIVSLMGAALGVALSYAILRVVLGLMSNYIPLSEEIGVDQAAVSFAVAAALLASVLASLAPLWQGLRTAPNSVLNEGVRSSRSARSRRVSQGLVIAEVALAFTLLAASALLIAQIERLNHVQPGFDPQNLLTFQLTVTDTKYQNRMQGYRENLTKALGSLPGVTNAALISHLPLAGCCYSAPLFPEGHPLPPETVLSTSFQVASPEYFQTMRIPLLKGRLLTAKDTGEKPVLVVINEAAAKRFWGNQDPVGAYAHLSAPNGTRVRVIGVVGDVRNDGLKNPPIPEMYINIVPNDFTWASGVVRSRLSESALLPEIRRAIHQVNPNQPIYDVRTMEQIAQDSLTLERSTSMLTLFFAGAALLLAALGVYGVMAYMVRQRTVEFGTRMALGAVSHDLLRLVIGDGLKIAGGGLLLGALVVVATTILLVKGSVIHGVEPLSFVSSALIIAAVTMLASFYPAWRASQLSPMVAIRNEPETMWLRTREQIRRLAGGVSHLLSREEPGVEISESSLLGSFVEATRSAQDFDGALSSALAAICETLGAQSAILLQTDTTADFRWIAGYSAVPEPPVWKLPEGFLLHRLQFYSAPLPLNQGDYEAAQHWAESQRPQHIEELKWLAHRRVRLAVVLRTSTEILGILLLGPQEGDAA